MNPVSPVITLTQELVRIPSITPVLSADYPFAKKTLDVLEAHAIESGAQCWRLPSSGGHDKWFYPVDNLYAEWTFGNPRYHLIFMGHTDVVPVGQEDLWSVSPFGADIKDGYLYGRGTTDMKGAVAAFFCAIKRAGVSLRDIRIGAVITTDEERAAVNGTRHVLKWLNQQGRCIDAALVGEPSSPHILGTHMKFGRRGSLGGRLIVSGNQGHVAYPDSFINPNRGLNLALAILHTLQWNDGDAAMPSTHFETVAIESGNFNTSAIIPNEAHAMWNIRYTPQQTPEGLLETLQNALLQPPEWALTHPDITYLSSVKITANITTSSRPYINKRDTLSRVIAKVIHDKLSIDPVMNCTGGTTDGRFVHTYFPNADIVEFGPPEMSILDHDINNSNASKTGGMHQVDERIKVTDLINLETIYAELLLSYNQDCQSSHVHVNENASALINS